MAIKIFTFAYSSLGKYQMMDDVGAAGGHGEPWGPGLGGFGSCSSHCGCGPGLEACGGKAEDKEWKPITMPGHLVKDVKIKSVVGCLDCVKRCCCDWRNKELKWPIARQERRSKTSGRVAVRGMNLGTWETKVGFGTSPT